MWSAILISLIDKHQSVISAVRWWLLGGDVLATWMVGAGILWESQSLSVNHVIARRFVFIGVVLEPLCSVALFAFDDNISDAQQSKIIALDSRANVMLAQLEPRDFNNKEEFEKFVAAIRGKFARKITIYTLPDPEASMFGFEIVYAFQEAGIPHDWIPLPQNKFDISGASSTGLTLLEPGAANGDATAKTESDAFFEALRKHERRRIYAAKYPFRSSLPALFVGLHQPPFSWLPRFNSEPGQLPRPPWEEK